MNNEFGDAMKKGFRQLRLRGRAIMGTGMETELTGADIVSVRISEGCDSGILPGNVLSASCTLVLDDSRGQWQPGGEKRGAAPLEGAAFTLELGVFEDGRWIYSPMGAFICHDAASDENGAAMTLTCNDSIETQTGAVFVDELTYPKPLRDVWKHIVAQTGYEWVGTLPNGDIIIDAPPDWGDISLRTAMGYVAQAAGCFVRVDRNGILEAVPLMRDDAPVEIGPSEYITRSRLDNYFGTVNRLKVTTVNNREDSDSEPEVIVIAPEASVDLRTIEISANPLFITGGAHTRQLAEAMKEALAGLSYQECRFTWRGDPQLSPGTLLRVTGLDGSVTECTLSRQTMEFSGGFFAECVCGAPDVQDVMRAAVTGDGVDAGRIVGLVPGRIIAADAITARKIAAGAVTADKIAAGAITADKIEAGSVTAGKIAADAVTADKIGAGAVTAEKIASKTITAEQLKAGLITADSGLIAVGAIHTAQIADSSITEAKIVSLNADVIKSGTLQTDRLLLVGEGGVVYEINAASSGLSQAELSDEKYRNYINGSVIVANSITARQIAAGTITANEIAANAVTAAQIDVADLFAAEATIRAINAMDIRSNAYLQLYVGQQVGQVQVGGRNLLVGTGEGIAAQGANASNQAVFVAAVSEYFKNYTPAAGTQVTLSFDWSVTAAGGTMFPQWAGEPYNLGGAPVVEFTRAGSGRYAHTFTMSEAAYAAKRNIRVRLDGVSGILTIKNAKLEAGNRATDWTPAPEDPVDSLAAGSKVEINENRVMISTPEFTVDIPTTEGMDVQVNDKGFSAPVISSPSVAGAAPGGVYTVGQGGDYGSLADAFGDINDRVISGDVVLKLIDSSYPKAQIYGVNGGHRVIISPANLANFTDAAAWEGIGATIHQLTDDPDNGGIYLNMTAAGAWKSGLLHVGHVGPMGIRGKRLALRATMYAKAEAAGQNMQMVAYLNGAALTYLNRPAAGSATERKTNAVTFEIPETADYWDELTLRCWASGGTAAPAGTTVYYRGIRLEIGDKIDALEKTTRPTSAGIAGLDIESCGAEVDMHALTFTDRLFARQSAAALNRCTFTGALGLRLWGGHGAMVNCYGSCATNAVDASGGGAAQIYGTSPGGTKTGLLETSNMASGNPGGNSPETGNTLTLKAKKSGTWDKTNGWWSSDAALRQGYTSANGRLKGGVWFDVPSGLNITKMALTLKRAEGYGKGSAVDVRIYGTGSAALSGEPATAGTAVTGTIAPGKTKTFDVTALKGYSGFVLYAADTALMSGKTYSTNYARFAGAGASAAPTLVITYTK